MLKRKILFSGELPPQTNHGVSNSNDINIRFLSEQFEVYIDEEIVDYQFHKKTDLRKLGNFVRRVFNIIALGIRHRFSYFYIVYSTSVVGSVKSLLLILLFKVLSRGLVIIHIHRGDLTVFMQKSRINQLTFRMVERCAHKIIGLSQKIGEAISDHSKLHILENTIENEYAFGKKPLFDRSRFKFLYISNYIEEKGILNLLEVFKSLDERFHLECYGNFTDSELKSRILAYQSPNILVNGPILGEDKFRKMFLADALILPSLNEGKPLVLIEAMSVGTPFIASNVGYIGELPYEGYPFLYNLDDSDGLRKIIQLFVNGPNLQDVSYKLFHRYKSTYGHSSHRTELLKIFT